MWELELYEYRNSWFSVIERTWIFQHSNYLWRWWINLHIVPIYTLNFTWDHIHNHWVLFLPTLVTEGKKTRFFFSYTVAVTPHGYASRFEISFVDKFDVAFGREGETMSLGCTVVINPDIKRFKPDIEWYRNGENVWQEEI